MADSNLPWGIHTIRDIYASDVKASNPVFRWAYAVGRPYYGNRIVAAWWVLTGRAYALRWPEPGELEAALGYKAPKSPSAFLNKNFAAKGTDNG